MNEEQKMIEQQLYAQLCADVLPLFRRIPTTAKYTITLGGSHGKGLSDKRSDFDFRVYYEACVDGPQWGPIIDELNGYIEKWKALEVEIDGVWPRSIAEVDKGLDVWLSGEGSAQPYIWNVWGYNMLTDIYNQAIVEDPCGVAQAWKDRLSNYPDALRDSILKKHGDSLRYWCADYHYYNKSVRQDYVFMASITARLMNDIMQIIYALNRFYFPGDGLNLVFTKKFAIKPEGLEERAVRILYPVNGSDCLDRQYHDMISLIDDVLQLLP
jgi:hypothetical protein